MERNFTKPRLAARRTPSAETRWRFILWIGIIVAALITVGFCTYLYKTRTLQSIASISMFTQMGEWLEARKTHLQSNAPKPVLQQVATEENTTDSQIHFEFYNALPNMQVATADPIPKTINPKPPVVAPEKEVTKKPIAKPTSTPQIARVTAPVKPQPKVVRIAQQKPPKSKARQTPFGLIVSAEEIEREFADQLKQKQYIIQLGMFRDSDSAKRYRRALSRAGLNVTVVKVNEGRLRAYRIQQGPFLNVHRAKLAQKSLQKKGIASLVVRMNQG